MIVQKFGGTSVKSVARIKNVANIVARAAAQSPVVVVVSAMGDTTDYLVKLARQVSQSPTQREYDMLLATGEQISIALVAMALNDMGCKAVSLTAAQLGIITGWGGTQRLPRLVGSPLALEMFATARRLSAREALGAGLVSHVDSDALERALALASLQG